MVASLGVERKPISILFSDIRGFTTICEAMRPAQLLELLRDYFQEMDEVIIATDGILTEFHVLTLRTSSRLQQLRVGEPPANETFLALVE